MERPGISSSHFDIVVPIGPKDVSLANMMLEYTKTNVLGYRNIYLVSYDPEFSHENCITVNENKFPFTIKDVVKYHGKRERNGWYLQQLLKLYAGTVIDKILDTYLVIDSDTFFLKPTVFIENGLPLYNPGTKYHEPYFKHMNKMHPSLRRVNKKYSGISHHMLFQKEKINHLFRLVEEYHGSEKQFWEIFLENITVFDESGASEYEIYFNYIQLYHENDFKIRKLSWINTPFFIKLDFDYISCHHYLIKNPGFNYKIKKYLLAYASALKHSVLHTDM